jgi:hypothetical protein
VNLPDTLNAEHLLWWVIKRGFARHVVGPVDDPHVIVLIYDWGAYLDVAHVRGIVRTEAARIPRRAALNVYRPDTVVWHYWGGLVDALNVLRLLPPPSDPSSPTRPYEPPRTLIDIAEDGPQEALTVDPRELDEVRIRLANCKLPGG